MLIVVLIAVGKRVDGGGQEKAKEGNQIEGDLGEDSSEGTTSGKCADVGGKEPVKTDTGKDGDLVEGASLAAASKRPVRNSNDACTTCPAGKTTSGSGANASSQCESCPSDTYSKTFNFETS